MAVGIDKTVAHLRRLLARQRTRAEQRARNLRDLVPEARTMLREEYGATKVWLFGSLATGDVHPATDVDLAVEGLPSDQYFDALGALDRLFPCDVDLVRLEDAPTSLRDRVAGEGILV